MSSGYTYCACRDCFDEIISSDIRKPELCSLCFEAGCDREQDGGGECCRAYVYSCDRGEVEP